MSGFDAETATRQELERMARRLSDLSQFQFRADLNDAELLGLLDDAELRELIRRSVREFKAEFH